MEEESTRNNKKMVCAPCGYSEAFFHKECLEKMKKTEDEGGWRCPHCNMVVEEELRRAKIKGRLDSIMTEWFGGDDDDAVWIAKKPHFVKMQSGMLRGDNEEKALILMVTFLVEKMKKMLQDISCVQVKKKGLDMLMFSCIRKNGCLLKLHLCRTAFCSRGGGFLCDGYTLTARQVRISSSSSSLKGKSR